MTKPATDYAKIKATKAHNRAKFADQTIVINQHWKIVRADEYNWEVRHKGKFYGFYGKLLHAFMALEGKMLGAEAKDSLAACISIHRGVVAKIEMALKGLK